MPNLWIAPSLPKAEMITFTQTCTTLLLILIFTKNVYMLLFHKMYFTNQ